MTALPLAHVRALEAGRGAAAAFCGRLLACFGAQVVKVEPPGGDPLRREGAPPDGQGPGPLFLYLNAGKLGISLDLDRADGADLFRRLAARADLVVEDLGPGEMERRGLGYPSLAAANGDLIYVSISPFGGEGPYAAFRACDIVLYALGGYMYITGEPAREPLQGPPWLPSYLAGAYAFVGALLALWSRQAGGGGQRVEVTELEALAGSHQWTQTLFNYSGTVQRRQGNRYYFSHPNSVYACADGHVSLSVATEDQFERFCLMLGMPELREDPRFANNAARCANAQALDETVAPWFRHRRRDEVVALAQELRIPAAPVLNLGEVLSHPHLGERGFWQEVEHGALGRLRLPGPPVRLGERATLGPAPAVGEHNRQVYGGWLALDEAQLERLRGAGVI